MVRRLTELDIELEDLDLQVLNGPEIAPGDAAAIATDAHAA